MAAPVTSRLNPNRIACNHQGGPGGRIFSAESLQPALL